ncbi:hypothetical protein BDZ89DRAFT_1087709 [Hymenopellis radicata]|nr:hypothetical protein BDZ89DRAFT_1087709 [Hymenopellis radicata]
MAVLSYSLIPEGIFPTPLKQLLQTISHLVERGTPASEIYLVGDSAGANLILQLFAHGLHPIPCVPQTISPETKFGGVYLMSPWVDPLGETFAPSMPHAAADIFYPAMYKLFGTMALIGVPPEQRMYMQMIELPAGFFDNLNQPNMLRMCRWCLIRRACTMIRTQTLTCLERARKANLRLPSLIGW